MSKDSLSRPQIVRRAGDGIQILQLWMDKIGKDVSYEHIYFETYQIMSSVCDILQEIQTGSEITNLVEPEPHSKNWKTKKKEEV